MSRTQQGDDKIPQKSFTNRERVGMEGKDDMTISVQDEYGRMMSLTCCSKKAAHIFYQKFSISANVSPRFGLLSMEADGKL